MSSKYLFDKLREMATEIHPYSWCVIRQKAIPTSHLIYDECSKCKEYILNKGICDPI